MSALKVTVNSLTREVVLSNTSVLKVGDTETPVELRFSSASVLERKGVSAFIKLTIKRAAQFTAEPLATLSAWTRGASDNLPYTGVIDLNGADLITAIGNAKTLTCYAEVYFEDPEGSEPWRSQFEELTIQNSITREDDPDPTPSISLGNSMAEFLTAGDNVTITPNPTTGEIVVASTGGGGGGGGGLEVETLDISTAGSTTIAAPVGDSKRVILNVGVGSFAYTLPISTSGAQSNQIVTVFVNWDPRSRAQITLLNNNLVGTELYDKTPTASATTDQIFSFDGTAWTKAGPNLTAEGIDPLSDLAVDLSAYWRFENGALLTDSSGNGLTLTNTNGVTNPSGGKLGYGAGFSAPSSQRLSINTDLLGGKTVFAAGVWVKSLDSDMAILGSLVVYLGTITANVTQFVVVIGGVAHALNGPTLPNDGAWHLVTAWKTAAAMFLAVDNGTPTTLAVTGAVDAATTYRIGNGGDGSNYATSTFDEFFLRSSVPTQAQWDAFYNGGAGAPITV